MIGLFIGSFNPPTLAHLNICLKLEKKLTKIVLIPVNSNEKELIDINNRIAMLEIYTRKYPFLVIDDIMKNYSYLNYRIIDILKNKYNDVTLIIGSDLLNKLDTFDNYQYLLENYSFIVIKREKDNVNKIIDNKFKKYQDKFKIIKFNSDISSTKTKELLRSKQSVKNILDEDVFKYINEHHLY